jgi:hypothetical protein
MPFTNGSLNDCTEFGTGIKSMRDRYSTVNPVKDKTWLGSSRAMPFKGVIGAGYELIPKS